jgi:hypothetical protein
MNEMWSKTNKLELHPSSSSAKQSDGKFTLTYMKVIWLLIRRQILKNHPIEQ